MPKETWEQFLKKNQIDTGDPNIPASRRPQPGSAEAIAMDHLKDKNWGESRDSYRMDGNKLPWHKDRLQAWADRERIVPLHIDMGISTGCNLACHFCYGVPQGRQGFEARGGKMTLMPLETIRSVFSDAKESGVRSIALVGEAENTLNPALYPSIEFARDINFDVSLATHGANFTEEHVEPLMTSLQWLRVNISAATPESYELVHQRPWLQRVIDGTKLLVDGRARGLLNSNGKQATIGYQMVLTNRNLDQVVPMAKLGREMGIDYTVIKACSDTPDGRFETPHEEYLEMSEAFREAETYSTDDYQVIVRWNKLGNMGFKEYGVCHGTRFIIAMSGDGSVFPCGHWFAIERDRFRMGNVNDTRLSDIFKSERYWEVQNEIHKLDLRHCETNCRQHAVNQSLDKVSKEQNPSSYVEQIEPPSEPAQHVNFV